MLRRAHIYILKVNKITAAQAFACARCFVGCNSASLKVFYISVLIFLKSHVNIVLNKVSIISVKI